MYIEDIFIAIVIDIKRVRLWKLEPRDDVITRAACRFERLVELVTMIGDKGELPIAMALASVVANPHMVSAKPDPPPWLSRSCTDADTRTHAGMTRVTQRFRRGLVSFD